MNRTTLLAMLMIATPAFADLPRRQFSHPDRIRYDDHCLIIDGKDTFIFSGAFHYFRCPKPLWRDRMARLKAMGLNTVETYVAWNVAEPEKPASLDDYSKINLTDLDDFITLAEQNGLNVIIRPGPYICAEWDDGGFPRWLLSMRPASVEPGHWFRSDDPVFLAWSRHWLKAVCQVVAKHQITQKAPGQPGVILFQLENEYDYADFPDDVKINHVKALAQEATADGIDVPLFTCWTKQVRGSADPVLRQVFDSCNLYPRWGVDSELNPKMAALRTEQPDAPMMTTELQGGWFTNVGGEIESDPDKAIYGTGVTPAQINNVTLLAIQNGDTLTNYYMAFGGTNFGDMAARRITTTYDYSCPIRECGGVDEKYFRVQAIGAMIKDHGASLARSDPTALTVTGAPDAVTIAERHGADGSSYIFVRTSQHDTAVQGSATVSETDGDKRTFTIPVDLEPFGSKVLWLPPGVNDASKGQWLPGSLGTIARPDHVPTTMPIDTALTMSDNGPADWSKFQATDGIPDPGVLDSRFLFYKLSFDLLKADEWDPDHMSLTLSVAYPDAVLIESGGKLYHPTRAGDQQLIFSTPGLIQSGHNEMTLLYECAGHSNGGSSMEDPAQITGVIIGNTPQPTPIADWKIHPLKLRGKPTRRIETTVAYDDSKWDAADVSQANQIKPGQSAVFRATVDLASASPTVIGLDFAQFKGTAWIYVNGKQVASQDNSALESQITLARNLRNQKIVIAVIVTAKDVDGGMAQPGLLHEAAPDLKSVPFKIAVAGESAGTVANWSAADVDDSSWQKETIGQTPPASAPQSFLTWHRLKFSLPAQDPHVWVPWCARLNATGNGFLYLNGHPLGRYWQVGPQHDFYLPECWLNVGPGQQNVLTLSMRPVKGDVAQLQKAEIRPYSAYAEVR